MRSFISQDGSAPFKKMAPGAFNLLSAFAEAWDSRTILWSAKDMTAEGHRYVVDLDITPVRDSAGDVRWAKVRRVSLVVEAWGD